ncbi:MAG: lysoplasmalogenase [Faecalibacterium sp.]|nr:lysoplasmalogenase [Ruminococcus sp.]MCM1392684.1 lysoplasmalogenase [Ruminococcus sp.]MCM1484823.1 lysoplasmalogenase [Faecalibacterium sp.]
MVFVPVVFGLIFLIIFIVRCKDKRSVSGVYTKNSTSMMFLLTAVMACYQNPAQWKYGLFITVGLVFGMLGDIYLDLKWVYPDDMKKYLEYGFICFGFGHMFYIPAIAKAAQLTIVQIIIAAVIGIVVAVGNLLLEKPMKQKFGEFKLIVSLYSFILATMVATAVISAIVTAQAAFIILAVGAILFIISDLILSPMYFGEGKNTPLNFILNHVTYYAGQFLIALSIYFMAATPIA